MNPVYILLMTAWLHGGPIVVEAIQAPSAADCLMAKPLVHLEKVTIGPKTYKVDHLAVTCTVMSEDEIIT